MINKLRIFVASPSDMSSERSRVDAVAAMLKPTADELDIFLQIVDWNSVVPNMGRPEDVILDQLKPTSWDVFIGILWHRFGTPPANKDDQTRKEYLSGTEEEFKTAYRLWQQYRRPRIVMYRCQLPPPINADVEQLKLVEDFFAQFDAVKGAHPGLYQRFDTTESFEKLLLNNMQKLLFEYAEGMAEPSVPSELTQARGTRILENLPRRASCLGREDELSRILHALSPEDHTWGILIDGIGGSGKTTLAIEAAHRCKASGMFDVFIFVSAKEKFLSPSGIHERLPIARNMDDFISATARVLGATDISELPANDKGRALLNILRGKRALLVYDNLETLTGTEQEAMGHFLRELPQGCKAIITSRRRGGEGSVWLRLRKLGWGAAREIIESEISRDSQLADKMRQAERRWQELYDATYGSPLALVTILGLIRTRATLTFDHALRLLRSSRDSDLQEFIFREALSELNVDELTALRALSFFDSSATSDALMRVTQLSPSALGSSIDHLSALSLVDIKSGHQQYALHPLTRKFVHNNLLTDEQLISRIEARFEEYWWDYAKWQEEIQRLSRRRKLPEDLQPLERLSLNHWWSWSDDGDSVFCDLDADAWEECEHNPRRLLNEVSDYRLMEMATEPSYIERVRHLASKFDEYMTESRLWRGWNSETKIGPANPVAYFCMEYGVHNSLPIYSGGLGILAGDHLKSASDINLPLIAVGLFYRYGYFRQQMTREGWQEEHYGENHPSELPVERVTDEAGEPVYVHVMMRSRLVRAQAWRASVGRVSLYLLDANIPENEQTDRMITMHLYGGDRETRMRQEMLLGIGGVRLLRRLGISPHVFHLIEDHTAFATLELVRELTEGPQYLSFERAAQIVRERCVFTTQTAFPNGDEQFSTELIKKCFGDSYAERLGLKDEEFLDLGRVRPDSGDESFGLTPLAIRLSRSTNGVSLRNGEVLRDLWQEMWRERAVGEVPITTITSGIHLQSWIAPPIRMLYEKYVGADWVAICMNDIERWQDGIRQIPLKQLWETHELLKQRLIAFIRKRAFHDRSKRKEDVNYTAAARSLFNPDTLTIGFATRVASHKRWSLLLTDPDRLTRLMKNVERPIQFVFAGKAHPQDQDSKLVLQRLAQWGNSSLNVMRRAVFLQDYNQAVAKQLVQSVDVWLSVPRKPLEASGTSGQKAAINGVLNLSVLDGWWVEGYDGTNGWTIGDAELIADKVESDSRDVDALYRALEEEVIPQFYERNKQGLPERWVTMMLRAMETITPCFNSDRMVSNYAEEIYSR